MPVRFHVDAVNVGGQRVSPSASSIAVVAGESLDLNGWALDQEANVGVADVNIYLDDKVMFRGNTRLSRPDLAQEGPAAMSSGFIVAIPTSELAPGDHLMRFVLTLASGAKVGTDRIKLEVNQPEGVERPERIVIAGAGKTAGRHVASVLRRYAGIQNPEFGPMSDGEHLLTDAFLHPVKGKPFVFHCHPHGRQGNLSALLYHGLKTVVTWRNLGDIVISMDDHTRLQPEATWRNTYNWIDEREPYIAMPEQKRYEFQIRTGIQWYLMFYLTWRRARIPLIMRYEWMVADPMAYFRYLLKELFGDVHVERLEGLIAPTAESDVNAGLVGRSRGLSADEEQIATRRASYATIRAISTSCPSSSCRGSPTGSVRRSSSPARKHGAHLLSEGVKRKASPHWLVTHQFAGSTVRLISSAELDGYPSGVDLY